MSQAIYPPPLTFQSIVPRTAIPLVAANIVIPVAALNAKVIRLTFNYRSNTVLTGAAQLSVYLGSALAALTNILEIRQNPAAAPKVDSVANSAIANPVGITIAGSDATANTYTIVEIDVFNWDLLQPHWGKYHASNPNNVAGQVLHQEGIFSDTAAVLYDGFVINTGARLPAANCYYQVDQIG